MKYIVIEIKAHGITREMPIIFPEALVHLDVANQMIALLRATNQGSRVRPISAGFLSSLDAPGHLLCTGKSETLGLESREGIDARLIRMMDYMHGVVG